MLECVSHWKLNQMFWCLESWHQSITDVLGLFKGGENTDGEFLKKHLKIFAYIKIHLLISKYMFAYIKNTFLFLRIRKEANN